MLLEGRSRNINARRRKPECIKIRRSARQHVLISDNSPVRKNYFDILTLNRIRMQGYCDVYKWTFLKRTSPEVKCLHLMSLRREMCMSSGSSERDLSQIFTRRRFLHAQREKR